MTEDLFIKILSTFFYVGYFPYIPGTIASIVGIFIFLFLSRNFYLYLITTLSLLLLGFFVSSRAEKLFKKKDPECVVIDEISAVLLAFFMIPINLINLLIGFFLFRIFDGLKPYPIDKIQKSKGSLGIMLDDITAALYTNLCLQLLLRLISSKDL